MAYEIVVLTNMVIAVLFALSLNVITGFCGQVSLGHAAFLGVGAYTSAMLSKAGVPMVITFIPDFLKERSNCLEISTSSTGTIFGINSTMVTSVPIAL